MPDYTTLDNGLKVPTVSPVGSAGIVIRDDLIAIDAAIGNARGYVHEQTVPAATWTIAHNLGRAVTVTTLDVNGYEIVGEVRRVDLNVVEVSYYVGGVLTPIAGRAEVS